MRSGSTTVSRFGSGTYDGSGWPTAEPLYFQDVYPLLEEVYGRDQQFLVDLNLDLLQTFCSYLRSPVRIVRASTLDHDGDNTDRIVQLVRSVAGSIHLTSTFGTDRMYISWAEVLRAGIGVRVQEFTHPVYDQPFGAFIPQLAAVDLLFCCECGRLSSSKTVDGSSTSSRICTLTVPCVGNSRKQPGRTEKCTTGSCSSCWASAFRCG